MNGCPILQSAYHVSIIWHNIWCIPSNTSHVLVYARVTLLHLSIMSIPSSTLNWGDIDDTIDVNTVLKGFGISANINKNQSNTSNTQSTELQPTDHSSTTQSTNTTGDRSTESSTPLNTVTQQTPPPTNNTNSSTDKTKTTEELKSESQSSDVDINNVSHKLSHTTVSDSTVAGIDTNAAAAAADDDDDSVLPVGGLHPNDKTAEVVILNSGTNIYKAAESFESLNIPEALLRGIYDMKFTSPSKIQAQALPIILDQKNRPNLIGQAQHGSGKTAAFCLGILCQIDVTLNTVQALVVTPTRELAIQITDVAKQLSKYTEIKIQCIVPQMNISDGPILSHVCIGTPGSIKSKLDKRQINSKTIKLFVADEADQMVSVEEGLGDQTIAIKNKLSRASCQILLFSATFDGKTSDFAKAIAPNAVEIRIKTEELSLDGIKQFYVQVQNNVDKYSALSSIFSLLEIGASIIFVQTVATAKWLANQMRSDGYTVSLLHGKDMTPDQRDKVMNDFRAGKTNVLITTNVLSRGIDVLSVTLVVNYDIPVTKHMRADYSTYIHRIGRSGRFGRKGVAINFIHDSMSRRLLEDITSHFGKQLDVDMIALPYNDLDKSSQIVQKALGK